MEHAHTHTVICNTVHDSAHLNLLREGGTKHHCLTQPFRRHGVLLNNTTNLRLKTHIQHSVGFIQHQVTNEKDTQGLCLIFLPNPFTWSKLTGDK